METSRSRGNRIASDILRVLSIVAILLILYLGFLLFVHNLFPINYRFIALGIMGFFAFLFLIKSILKAGTGKYILNIFFCSLQILFLFIVTMYIQIAVRTLDNIQQGPAFTAEEKEKQHQAVHVNVKEDGFIVYLSGIDNYDEIEYASRSDVNIIAAINPRTKQVLLTSVPRDSYLRIAGGGMDEYDKLTHAGIYGVSSSIQTLENAFDIEVNYFVRLNFRSFMNMIDAIGGVDIYNPTEFTFALDSGLYFPEGNIHLDGESALAYVRERKSLPGGDTDRQKNQMRVLEAAFKKALSSQFILNYSSVMAAVSDSIETNMPQNTIMDFVNSQLGQQNEWTFSRTSIDGEDSYGLPSYAMPGYDLYVFVPTEESIQKVHDDIQELFQGRYQNVQN